MRTKLTRLGVALGTLLGLLGPSIPPADATTLASFTFTGTANVPGGLGYPCTTPPILDFDCPNELTVPKTGNTSAFIFSSDICVGVKSDVNKPKGTNVYGPLCTITASGVITGYCGLSLGVGAGQITWSGPPSKTLNFVFKFVEGGLFVLQGESHKGVITAVGTTIPDPTAGSCFSKTATRLIIVGEGWIVDPTI